MHAVDEGLPACGQTTYIHLLLLILLHIRMLKINLPVINPVAMSLNNNSYHLTVLVYVCKYVETFDVVNRSFVSPKD